VAVLPSAPGTRHGLAGVRLTSRLAHAARWCTSSTTSQSLAISSWMTSLVGSSSTRLVCTARIAPRPIHAVKSTRTPLLLVLVGPRDLEPPSWRHQSCLWDREIYISARAVPRQQFTSPVQSHNARKTNLLQPLSHNYEIPDALANTVPLFAVCCCGSVDEFRLMRVRGATGISKARLSIKKVGASTCTCTDALCVRV
jgi:hypothetical protein